MPVPKIAPYGSWKSPITADLIVAGTVGLGQLALDGADTYWVEVRPLEKGRYVVVRRGADGSARAVNPPPFNARTRVHEYGGGAYLVRDGTLWFSNFADQRLYRQDPGGEPRAITPEAELRYADGVLDSRRDRIYCVREDHREPDREAINTLASVPADGTGEQRVLVSGSDFYAFPRLSPDGACLAWISWNHPNLPWDGTDLWVAQMAADGSLQEPTHVAGGPEESIFQPEWSPDGTLHFVSDRSGWWNLYRWRNGEIEPLCAAEAEFGEPMWVFGMATYGFEAADRLLCAYTRAGESRLLRLNTATGERQEIATPYSDVGGIRVAPGRAVFIAASPAEPAAVIQFDTQSGNLEVLKRSSELQVDVGYLSPPELIEFPTTGGRTAYAFFYPPRNRDFQAPEGERPPLLVKSHGGPTGATTACLKLGIQFWTSRGIAVLDVNYGGSTGYGRAYRERLNGEWGVVDVDDCANGARYLSERGVVDPKRMAITGGSAGGYTTLCALTFTDVFGAGASHFGISELEVFVGDTHKFESRYLDRLIGPYPERKDRYFERSPIHFTDRLNCPVVFFQGLEDKIVPPNQAELMVDALRKKGLPVAYLPFEGEQHGFRQAANIKRALEGELYFYSRVFGFDLAESVEPVLIENLR